jgi:hypothetical protein
MISNLNKCSKINSIIKQTFIYHGEENEKYSHICADENIKFYNKEVNIIKNKFKEAISEDCFVIEIINSKFYKNLKKFERNWYTDYDDFFGNIFQTFKKKCFHQEILNHMFIVKQSKVREDCFEIVWGDFIECHIEKELCRIIGKEELERFFK